MRAQSPRCLDKNYTYMDVYIYMGSEESFFFRFCSTDISRI